MQEESPLEQTNKREKAQQPRNRCYNQFILKVKVYISVDFLLISEINKVLLKNVITYGVFNNNRFRTASLDS